MRFDQQHDQHNVAPETSRQLWEMQITSVAPSLAYASVVEWGPSLTLRVSVEGSSGEVVFCGGESEVVGGMAFVSREGSGEGLKLSGS